MNIYLIAKKLSHSFSPQIHKCLADYSYNLKELSESELEEFFQKREFDGLNITIPYKMISMQYLDEISKEADEIGAVNTVVNREGRLFGYNTDYFGFKYMVSSSGIEIKGKKVVVIGGGGASKPVVLACRDLGAQSVRILTHSENKAGSVEKYYDAQVLVNASPVGMFPNTNESPVCIESFKACEGVLDLIYNPACTRLMFDAQRKGIKTCNGLGMLVAQAKKACELFTGTNIEDEVIEPIRRKIEGETKNILLVGMPGCGKSTIGSLMAQALNREFIDTDKKISDLGETPEELIINHSEEYFRGIETKVLAEESKKSGCVISTGGGIVTRPENLYLCRQNSFVIFVEREIEKLATKARPLSAGGAGELEKMYERRLPKYMEFSDIRIKNGDVFSETAEKLINMYREMYL